MHQFLLLLIMIPLMVKAGDFYITSPWEQTLFTAGKKQMITWTLIKGGPNILGINVDLMDGDDANANYIGNIASGLGPDTTAYEWDVPMTIQNSDRVFVRITGINDGGAPIYRYSHRFMITGGEGTPVSATRTGPLAPPPSVVNVGGTSVTLSLPPVVSLINPDDVENETTATKIETSTEDAARSRPTGKKRKGTHRGQINAAGEGMADRLTGSGVAILVSSILAILLV